MENKTKHTSVENLINTAVDRVKQTTEEQIHRAETYTRKSPLPALAIAIASGYVLRSLPVRALAGVVLRLALVLAKPFIIILGAANLYEFVRGRGPVVDTSEEYVPGESSRKE